MKQDIIKDRDFVILGLENWDDTVGSKNASNIAREIATNNRVLFVNMPLEIGNVIRKPFNPLTKKRFEVILGKEKDIIKIEDTLWKYDPKSLSKSINWIPNTNIFELFNKHNSKALAYKINSAIERLGFKDVILFIDNELFRSLWLKDYIKPAISIYYMRDFITEVDYWKKHGQKCEQELIAKSDVVVTNSEYYADYGIRYNQNTYFVGQGCDLNLFKPEDAGSMPEDLKGLNSPIIGYAGALTALRLNPAIIEFIARTKPEWSIVLVGTEDETFKKSALHNLENVYFLGQKNIKDVPTYLNHFDVCINPQAINPITVGNYPLKIDEYLAMGKPVVATKTRAMEYFKQYVYLANDKEEYIEFVYKAFAENSRKKALARRNFAASHTWQENVRHIYETIRKSENIKFTEPAY